MACKFHSKKIARAEEFIKARMEREERARRQQHEEKVEHLLEKIVDLLETQNRQNGMGRFG